MNSFFKSRATQVLLIIAIVLIVVGGVFFRYGYIEVGGIKSVPAQKLQDAVDLHQRTLMIGIRSGASESQALELKSFIEKQDSIEFATYVSGAQALTELRAKYKDDPSFLSSLDKLGPNPIGGYIKIIVKDLAQKESIISSIRSADRNSVIEAVN
jgi:cell division protein FtsX